MKRASKKPKMPRQNLSCGIDVVEILRFGEAVERGGQRFLDRIFTPQEAAYAARRKRTSILHLAARFAAKEAAIKALSQLDPESVPVFRQIEVENDALGRPSIRFHDARRRGITLSVSLTHTEHTAAAIVVAQRHG